jgi:ribonucleoside-diphosphate reductase alpha chain
MVVEGRIDWDKLRTTVRNAVDFLDDVIDANRYPLKEIENITLANRKIGLGVMGFADMLVKLGIPYDSKEALKTGDEIMKFMEEEFDRLDKDHSGDLDAKDLQQSRLLVAHPFASAGK